MLPLTKQLTCSDLNLYFTDDFTTMTETPKTPTDQCIDMEETNIAHIAGVIDAVASITIHISREDSYAMGYRYKPMVRLYRPEKDSPLMGKLDAYCEDECVNYSLSKEKREKSEVFNLRIDEPRYIRRFLKPLMPHLVSKYKVALLMFDVLVRMEEGEHENYSGFYNLVGLADELRSYARHGAKPKYTQEYFREEWSEYLVDT